MFDKFFNSFFNLFKGCCGEDILDDDELEDVDSDNKQLSKDLQQKLIEEMKRSPLFRKMKAQSMSQLAQVSAGSLLDRLTEAKKKLKPVSQRFVKELVEEKSFHSELKEAAKKMRDRLDLKAFDDIRTESSQKSNKKSK